MEQHRGPISRDVRITFPAIDWGEMREQKKLLFQLANKHPLLDGVISMYDHIQDQAWHADCPVQWIEEDDE